MAKSSDSTRGAKTSSTPTLKEARSAGQETTIATRAEMYDSISDKEAFDALGKATTKLDKIFDTFRVIQDDKYVTRQKTLMTQYPELFGDVAADLKTLAKKQKGYSEEWKGAQYPVALDIREKYFALLEARTIGDPRYSRIDDVLKSFIARYVKK